MTSRRWSQVLVAVACAAGPAALPVAAQSLAGLQPDIAFVQVGAGRDTHATVIGASWTWSWRREFAGGHLGGYWEASFGRWNAEQAEGESSAWNTQLGATPVLRWTTGAQHDAWFVEAGIGANLILPLYRSRERSFSTAFNFGDHLAIGRRFGQAQQHELALRLQHFSNAGIKRPNPGADFLQLRYSRAL